MEVVINKCFGGFCLSPQAVKRLAELQGRNAYFFIRATTPDGKLDFHHFERVSVENAAEHLFWSAFDTPNVPPEFDGAWWEKHSLSANNLDRTDPNLIAVVKELGEQANGMCAKLKVVNIPDGTDYTIEEYDGLEHIAESHRTWG